MSPVCRHLRPARAGRSGTWAAGAIPEFNYTLNEDGQLHAYGHQPQDYLTDVLARKGTDFINSSAAEGKPFFLELATFAPHSPYTPAPARRRRPPGTAGAAVLPTSTRCPANAPRWLAGRPPLTADQIQRIDNAFRRGRNPSRPSTR